ncbi:MAG TPA: LysR family transcriptional regulator [Ramlibacter sp.]|nr:LysR family transcriptional regulator [Ramlibacter sp.]
MEAVAQRPSFIPREPNLARLDLVSLRLVLLCTELGSLSLAAGASNLSLSGASGRVARIEQAYGRKLFIRQARGLEPTVEGVIVARHARRVLDVLGEMSQSLAQARPCYHA